jgi:hypothetical protein
VVGGSRFRGVGRRAKGWVRHRRRGGWRDRRRGGCETGDLLAAMRGLGVALVDAAWLSDVGRPNGAPSPRFKSREGFGWAGGLGVLVVDAARLSDVGWPNGPPSHRLAPVGFYGGTFRGGEVS